MEKSLNLHSNRRRTRGSRMSGYRKNTLKEGILPKTCPDCGKPMWFDQKSGLEYCRNPDCPSKKKH